MRRPPSLLPALITPFTTDGSLDTDAHRFNLRTLWNRNVEGFLVGGSTGEGPYLEPGERSELTGLARSELGGAAFLLCGVAAETPRQAAAHIEEAATGDADAVLVVTPTTLVRGRHELVVSYFRDVAETSPLPVFLYTVPAVTGYSLPVEFIIELSRVAGIAGVKDSSGEPDRAGAIRDGVDDDFIIMIGSSRAIALGRERGADGAITASANYATSMVQAAVDGVPGAQERLTSVVAVVEPNGIPGTKAAAGMVGLRPGMSRRPLLPVSREVATQIAAALARLDESPEAPQPASGKPGASSFGQLGFDG